MQIHVVYKSFYLKYGINKLREINKYDKETSVQAQVSLFDFSPPEVYKSHILNRIIQLTNHCMYSA